jgi:hypothetical protein
MYFHFLCYNYYTFYVSYLYAKNLKKKGYKCLLYLYEYEISFSDINEEFWDEIIYIQPNNYKVPIRTKLISNIKASSHGNIRRYYGYFGVQELKRSVNVTNKNILIVYKDNDAIFASAIEGFKLITKNHGEVVLIEEGMALYVKGKKRGPLYGNRILLQILRLIFGISFYGKGGLKQGYHPEINILIAKDIENLDHTQLENKLIIPQSKSLFTQQNIDLFIKEALKNDFNSSNVAQLEFDYFYVGQPLSNDNICSIKDEILLLEKIFSNIPTHKNVVIKPHPRDDLKKYIGIKEKFKNVTVLEGKIAHLPAEIVFGMLSGRPIVLTPFSSAYKTIFENYITSNIYLLFKLLRNEMLDGMICDNIDINDRIMIPNDDEEYKKLIQVGAVSNNVATVTIKEIEEEIEMLVNHLN